MKGETTFLKIVIFLMGLIMLGFCIVIVPHYLIGANNVMSNWPILTDLLGAGMYLAAIVFYLVLYQGYRLLKMIDHKSAFSNVAVQALRWIKIEAYTICGLMILELPIFYIFADRDDSPGMLLVGIVFAGAPLVIAIFASVLQKLLHQAIEIKAENDLTI